MKRTFGQRVMTLIAALGLTTNVGAAANASTGVAVGRTGFASQSQSFASNQTWIWGDYLDWRNQKFSASCLNADGAYNGAKVHLWTCSGGQPRDQWYVSG
jgi:hypothetical protein